jgi:hypothetical protein
LRSPLRAFDDRLYAIRDVEELDLLPVIGVIPKRRD